MFSEDTGHGRTETRKATVVSSKSLAENNDFPGLKAFGWVEAARKTADGTRLETRYFALSWVATPEVLLATVPPGLREQSALAARRLFP